MFRWSLVVDYQHPSHDLVTGRVISVDVVVCVVVYRVVSHLDLPYCMDAPHLGLVDDLCLLHMCRSDLYALHHSLYFFLFDPCGLSDCCSDRVVEVASGFRALLDQSVQVVWYLR